MNTTSRLILSTSILLASGGLALRAAAAIPAPSYASADVVRATVDGHAYQTGGYGREEVDAMRRAQGPYDLRMTFSEGRHNDFVAGLKVRVEDAAGHRVFAYRDAGPLTDVKLPAGTYRVIADYNGMQRVRQVDIKPGTPTNLYLHWQKNMA